MATFDINTLQELREYNQLEAKTAKGGFPGSFWDTYSAFANTDGGVILLGVKESPDGSLHSEPGTDIPKLCKDFWNMVNNRQKISANIITERMVTEEVFDGNPILVIRVPRAERSAKPIYVGQDPKSGTFRRNHEGDYHCSLDEMALMFRDASSVTQDAKVLEKMDLSVFCMDTVRGYRNFFRSNHTNHLWNNEEDEVFMRKIGAIAIGEDGKYHPTAAGLLMFGYEFEITREFPNYFLDYQENRSLGPTRWTDRFVSTSGEWSGNVFDFVIEALRRMQQGLKVPFVLKGNRREDDTPLHKLLREAITNACVHADFYGRQGLVVQKSIDGYKLSNPGGVRISIKEAVNGGISDPRNGVMLKMFSLIDFGERAGSGLSEICTVWERIFHNRVSVVETHNNGVDRTTITMSTDGNEPDVEAMVGLYGESADSNRTKTEPKPNQTEPKPNQNRTKAEQIRRILELIKENKHITKAELASLIGIHLSSVQRRLNSLVKEGRLRHIGPSNGGSWEVFE